MRYFEEFKEGMSEYSTERYKVTVDEIVEFGHRWDPQPFHINPDAAKKTLFGGIVSPAVHLFSIAVRLVTKVSAERQAAIISGLGFNNLKLQLPVRPGDILKSKSTVIKSRLSTSKEGVGIVTFFSELITQRDEVAFSYETTVMIASKK